MIFEFKETFKVTLFVVKTFRMIKMIIILIVKITKYFSETFRGLGSGT